MQEFFGVYIKLMISLINIWEHYRKMRWFFIAALILLLPVISAKEYHMSLLAVSESSGIPEGSVADLFLEVKPGSGRIFIDTFPLTRVDTQISTRFAKSIACSHTDINCQNKDFFYTIRSNSVIVGGPSAGSALTVLTVAALRNDAVDESIAISGTINSGGLIGPVGSLEAKIRAAAKANLSTVLIPKGTSLVEDNESNTTTNLIDTGTDLGITVKEVSTIDEAVFEFTAYQEPRSDKEITANPEYEAIMREVATDLCDRTDKLISAALKDNSSLYTDSINLTYRAEQALENHQYYAQASYCFGANIKLSNKYMIDSNMSSESLQKEINIVQNQVIDFDKELDKMDLRSIIDLQTFEIVKERLIEAEDYLKEAVVSLETEKLVDARFNIAYALERYNSAVSWSTFFKMKGSSLDLDEETVRASCIEKLSEAEERYQYVQIYMPMRLSDTRSELDRAYNDLDNKEYVLCLFKASKAKAEADVVLSALGISEEQLPGYVETKLKLAQDQIARQQEKGNFPILGYSYFEYASNLRESDLYSALVYIEYSLELSNLDLYFDKNKKSLIQFDSRYLLIFILGSMFGVFVGLFITAKRPVQIKIRAKKR